MRHSDTNRRIVTIARSTLLVVAIAGIAPALCAGERAVGQQPSAASPTPQALPASTPRLASADNFRDVAGTDDRQAYRTTTGQALRRGIVYRSNALALSPTDRATLGALGVATVFDLRRPDEVATTPDVLPVGATYRPINVVPTPDNPTIASAAEGVAWMEGLYRAFVTNAGTRARFGDLLRALADGTGPQLYHCTGGKDRTGWATAVLLSVIQVPRDVVMQDYLLTNTYSAESIRTSYEKTAAANGRAVADAYRPMMVVQESYLQAAFDQVAASYGSMDAYITRGLGIDADTQARLRARFVDTKPGQPRRQAPPLASARHNE
jgi:protein-tyrosine phosphatase